MFNSQGWSKPSRRNVLVILVQTAVFFTQTIPLLILLATLPWHIENLWLLSTFFLLVILHGIFIRFLVFSYSPTRKELIFMVAIGSLTYMIYGILLERYYEYQPLTAANEKISGFRMILLSWIAVVVSMIFIAWKELEKNPDIVFTPTKSQASTPFI